MAAPRGGAVGMVSFLSALVYVVGTMAVVGLALLVAFQEKLVYVPALPGLTKSYPITPARLRLAYEDVWLRSADGVRLHAWFIKLFPDCPGEPSPFPPPSQVPCAVVRVLVLFWYPVRFVWKNGLNCSFVMPTVVSVGWHLFP